MQTILITGGTGMVGNALAQRLIAKGYTVIILTRHLPVATPINGVRYAEWNIKTQTIDRDALQQADAIIHLAGAGVMEKRWSNAYREEIQSSRINSSACIAAAMQQHPNKIKTVICASATGWYGPDDAESSVQGFTEDHASCNDFLGETCRLWEESSHTIGRNSIRLVILRIGIVLSPQGGALSEFKKPIRFGLATIMGSGRQKISWIHIDDLCRIFTTALQQDSIAGVYNAVSPEPVSNKYLITTLANILRKSFFIPVHIPAFILKLILGGSSIEVLKSCTVSCKKIKATGFTFLYPTLESAIKELCKK